MGCCASKEIYEDKPPADKTKPKDSDSEPPGDTSQAKKPKETVDEAPKASSKEDAKESVDDPLKAAVDDASKEDSKTSVDDPPKAEEAKEPEQPRYRPAVSARQGMFLCNAPQRGQRHSDDKSRHT